MADLQVNQLTPATSISGDDVIMVVQGGIARRATLEDIRDAKPDANGVYPDVPMNRVALKIYGSQTSLSPTFTADGNLSLVEKITADIYPCLINRSAQVVDILSGGNCRKNVAGTPVNLHEWSKPAMVHFGKFWSKYQYDAITDTHIHYYSPYKIRGYKYNRGRFLSMFPGNVITNSVDGVSKTFLCSMADVYCKHSIVLSAAHADAKALGNITDIVVSDTTFARSASDDASSHYAWKNGETIYYTLYANPAVGAKVYSDAAATTSAGTIASIMSPFRAEAWQDHEVYVKMMYLLGFDVVSSITVNSVSFSRYATGDSLTKYAWQNAGSVVIYTNSITPAVGDDTYSLADNTFSDYGYDVAAISSTKTRTRNSQLLYKGITNVNSAKWATYDRSSYTDAFDETGGQSTYGQFHLNGVTLDILGHQGEKRLLVSDFVGGAIYVEPMKYLWRENALQGPYSKFVSGRIFKDSKWYEVTDLSKIAFTVTDDFTELFDAANINPAADGWQQVAETYKDTLIPSAIGGTSTTGCCDGWYGLHSPAAGTNYVPLVLGSASSGAIAGCSYLYSYFSASDSYASFGVSLAADDPSETIADGTIAQ